ncbi:MAG: Gldg family protein [Gemmatimonadota bacterium]|nr:Gldg family protein [Gemmatimonadota bacterium]
MKAVWTIARRELRSLFDHPTGYILLVVFLVINDLLFFRQAYLVGVASLRPMLQLLPWILLFFVPAVTMRALAEDIRSGTLEVVLAQPVSEVELLMGKYVGQVLFMWLALLFTVPVALGLSLGADVQAGVMVAQYLGAALLAAGLTGVGLWASSVTSNQITAYITGLTVMFLLILVGIDPLITGLPPWASAVVASLAVLGHFENVARGVIDLRDVVYFVTLTGLFLALAYYALMRRKLARGRETRQRLRLGTALIVVLLVVVNLFGRHIGGRVDLTPGNAYTLSPATRSILAGLDDLVTIKLFVSQELPSEFGIVKRDIADLLADLRSAGGGKVRVTEIDPADNEDAANEARSLGIAPVQFNVIGESEFQVKEGYLGLALQYADGTETIPFVERTEDLEYRLVTFVRTLTRSDRDVVGLVEAVSPQAPGAGPTYQRLRAELGRTYDVRTVVMSDSTAIASDVDVLVLAGTPFFLDSVQAERYGAFLRRGGGALVMANGMQIEQQGFMASARPIAWNTLLEPYGVSIGLDMVYDLASNERVSMPIQGGRLLVGYPFWLRALSTQESIVVQGLESAFLPWSSSIDTSNAVPGTVTPLFTTSRAGGVEGGRAFINPQRDFPSDSLEPQLVAVTVNPLAVGTAREAAGRLVIVGNSDFVTDQYAGSAPGGLLFVLNAVDWLAQDDALIQIRSKDRRPPPLVFEGRTTRDLVKYGNVIGLPLLLVLFAMWRLWRRRRGSQRAYVRAGQGTPS